MPASQLVVLTGTAPVEVLKVKPLARAVVKRILAFNGDTADHRIQIGAARVNSDGTIDAGSFVQILPDIVVPAGGNFNDQVPPAAVSSTRSQIYAIAARLEAAASAPVTLVVEWEES